MKKNIEEVNMSTKSSILLAEMAVENGFFNDIEDAYSVFKYVGYELLTKVDINDYRYKFLS